MQDWQDKPGVDDFGKLGALFAKYEPRAKIRRATNETNIPKSLITEDSGVPKRYLLVAILVSMAVLIAWVTSYAHP